MVNNEHIFCELDTIKNKEFIEKKLIKWYNTNKDATWNTTYFTKYKVTIVVRCASDDKFIYKIFRYKKGDKRPT